MVEAEEYRREFLEGVIGGKAGYRVELGAPLYVHGKIIGTLKEYGLKRNRATIWYSNILEFNGSSTSNPIEIPLVIRDGVAHFTIDRLWEGELKIWTGSKQVDLDIDEPVEDLVIDLSANDEKTELQEREVVLSLDYPEGFPEPKGSLTVSYRNAEKDGNYSWSVQKEVIDGKVILQAMVPSRLYYSGKNLNGYWIGGKRFGMDIDRGDDPLAITILARPAGVIYGQVFEPDGTPAENFFARLHIIELPGDGEKNDIHHEIKNSRSAGDAISRFVTAPVPLGGTYRVVAYRNAEFAMSEPIEVDEKKPSPEIELHFKEDVPLRGRVLSHDNEPIHGINVTLFCRITPNNNYGGGNVITDSEGRFIFESVTPDDLLSYQLRIEPKETYVPTHIDIQPDGTPMKIYLDTGLTATGKVVDYKTEQPVAGVKVVAAPRPYSNSERVGSTTVTDKNGEFQFTTLDGGEYSIQIPDYRFALKRDRHGRPRDYRINGGQEEPVTIEVRSRNTQ